MASRLEQAAVRGPHAVGVATREIADPDDPRRLLPLDVWYPAADSTTGAAQAEHPFGRPHEATQGAAPASGPFPLVLFSHGNSGLRRQSTFLTTHLASQGMVVAAPDHSGNTFSEMAAIRDEHERKRVHFEARRRRPSDMSAVLDHVLAGDSAWPEIDPHRIASLGHSFGGWTAIKLACRDPRVRAVCGLAPASEPFVGRKAFDPGELPLTQDRPVLLIAGMSDVLVDLGASVRPLFDRMAEPRALIGVAQTDHFHFCDGVELLHGMHAANPREKQSQPTSAYAELLPEERIHNILKGLVAGFFSTVFSDGADACDQFDAEGLSHFDPSLARLDEPSTSAQRQRRTA